MKVQGIILLPLILLTACSAVKPVEQPDQASLLHIEGVVQNVSGNEITLSLKLPEFKKAPESPVSEIAQQVVQKSLFLEGIKTEINGSHAVIREVRGNNVSVILEKPQAYAAGTTLNLKIPKKTIAIVDFEVIRGREKEAGRVTLEGLTSALIDSGHFIVVERTKLKAIMNELELSLSGLTKEMPEKVLGNLLVADLILTGTLAEISGVWDMNLRLINVRTGQAMAAISIKTPLFKPSELRDASPMNEDFEGENINYSWATGYKGKGAFIVKPETGQGAENSKRSLKTDFDFRADSQQDMYARMENLRKRDLSLYSGIEFYVKADKELTGLLRILISDRDDPNTMDAWVANFAIGTLWKKVRIPFEHMFIGRGWVKEGAKGFGAKPGKQILDISRVETISIGVQKSQNPPVRGTVWVDKVLFYRE